MLVGTVAALWRYPVKSMAGERLDTAELSWHGVAGDRRWAFVGGGPVTSGFPWLTIRQRSDLCRFVPVYTDPARPDQSPVEVATPDGRRLALTDPELAATLGEGLRLLKQDRGIFDSSPLSLIGAPTIAAIAEQAGPAPDQRRFRPNLVVATESGEPFAEEAWIGRTLRVGEARLRVDRRNRRCVIVNVDPDSAARDPRVLRTIARERGADLGLYATTVTPGRVAVGDAIHLDD